MDKEIKLNELSIVVVARNHNPTILNPDFLKYSEIVPSNWELSEPPICAEPIAQVRYKNSVTINAQLQRVSFTEDIKKIKPDDIHVPEIAKKYLETLPHVEYQSIGINPKGYLISNTQEEAEKFVLEKLIAPGPWQNFKGKQASVTAKFQYPITDGLLSISIEHVIITLPNKEEKPGIAFMANFHRNIPGNTSKERLRQLKKIIKRWNSDLDCFKSLVEKTFLQGGAGL